MNPMISRIKLLACLAVALYLAPAANSMQWQRERLDASEQIATATKPAVVAHPEQAIVSALEAIRDNRLDEARRTVEALLAIRPDYRLAHLLKGDLLMARAHPLATIGAAPLADEKLKDLRHEAIARLRRYAVPPPTRLIPANLLQLSAAQLYAVVVDASRSRLFLYRNDQGVPRYLADYYVTIGRLGFGKDREGDQRTPIGVYFTTGHLPRPELDKTYGMNAELYGVGAWPLSYPNEWDRQQGRTGHGIWLHGVPYDTYSRAPNASNGCVALSNPDMLALGRYLLPGTPVVVTPAIEWLDEARWQQRRDAARSALEAWRRDWESLDTQRYLAHYARDFRSGNHDLESWRTQKQAVNANKHWAKVAVSGVSLFAYPTRDGHMLMADFEQDYRSDNLENRMRKRLYFTEEAQGWRIVFEGAAV
jgi:murein L,D-transpeptidase YafK